MDKPEEKKTGITITIKGDLVDPARWWDEKGLPILRAALSMGAK